MKELYIKINFLFCCLLFLRKTFNNDKTIPDVSIIISIFNSENYLISCLNSIIYQSLKNIEIICINDGSNDESLNILKEFQKKDQRIIIISQNNEGAGIARNKGIMKSRGKYLGFVDSDDMLPDNFTLEIIYNKSIHNKALICGGSLNKLKKINGRLVIFNGKGKYIFHREEMIEYKKYQYDFGFFRFLYKSKFIKNNNIFFPNYLRYQDPPFFIKAMSKAKKFYALNYTTYLYRKFHKKIKWNKKKIIDQFNGFNDCLILSQNNNLNELYCSIVQRLNLELFIIPTQEFINNYQVRNHINKILNQINFFKLKNEKCFFKLNEIYKPFLNNNQYLEMLF